MRSKILMDLFHLYAPSYKEKPVSDFVDKFLTNKKIEHTVDEYGNIVCMNFKSQPILCAHMDCVGKEDSGKLVEYINLYKYGNDLICKGVGNIGADDKCGVYLMLLSIIDKLNVNLIFSIGEEVSNQNGIKKIFKDLKENEIFKSAPFFLVLDRKNSGDLICNLNNYGSKEFDEAMEKIGKKFNFKSVKGGYSDANTLSDKLNGANLSMGYYNPHSTQEFFSIKEMLNSYHYVKEIIKKLPRNIPFDSAAHPEKMEYTYPYYNDYDYNDSDFHHDVSSYWGYVNGTKILMKFSYSKRKSIPESEWVENIDGESSVPPSSKWSYKYNKYVKKEDWRYGDY